MLTFWYLLLQKVSTLTCWCLLFPKLSTLSIWVSLPSGPFNLVIFDVSCFGISQLSHVGMEKH